MSKWKNLEYLMLGLFSAAKGGILQLHLTLLTNRTSSAKCSYVGFFHLDSWLVDWLIWIWHPFEGCMSYIRTSQLLCKPAGIEYFQMASESLLPINDWFSTVWSFHYDHSYEREKSFCANLAFSQIMFFSAYLTGQQGVLCCETIWDHLHYEWDQFASFLGWSDCVICSL